MPSLGKRIATGRTAEVFAWGDDQVIKLFRDWFPDDAVESEAQIARAVHAAGMAAPWAGEVVEVNGRKGLVYERLDGDSMMTILFARPWMVSLLAQQFAELHAAMHRIHTMQPPDQRQRLAQKIQTAGALPDPLKARALKALEAMPADTCLCHGDFHPGNVLMTRNGPIVIDWIDVTRGHPLADLARSQLLIQNARFHVGPLGWLVRGITRKFLKAYLAHYFRIMPGDPALLERWLPIVAAARLNENIIQEEAALLALVKEHFSGESPS